MYMTVHLKSRIDLDMHVVKGILAEKQVKLQIIPNGPITDPGIIS